MKGTYRTEEGCHQATKELLEEIARIREIVPKKSVRSCHKRDVATSVRRKRQATETDEEIDLRTYGSVLR